MPELQFSIPTTDDRPPPPATLTVEMLPVHTIVPYENNPRHNAHVVADLAKLIQTVGWRQPIVVDSNMVILVGDTRYRAALLLNLSHVPVHIAHDLTPALAKAYRLADNKIGERSEWDYGKVASELTDLVGLEAAGQLSLMEATCFQDYEVEPILAADWSKPDIEAQLQTTGGANEGPLLPGDFDFVNIFGRDHLERVIHAVRRYRAKANAPGMSLVEAVARICQAYHP